LGGGLALAGDAVEAGGDDGDAQFVAERLVDDRAEDDVALLVGRVSDDAGPSFANSPMSEQPGMLSSTPVAPETVVASSGD